MKVSIARPLIIIKVTMAAIMAVAGSVIFVRFMSRPLIITPAALAPAKIRPVTIDQHINANFDQDLTLIIRSAHTYVLQKS